MPTSIFETGDLPDAGPMLEHVGELFRIKCVRSNVSF